MIMTDFMKKAFASLFFLLLVGSAFAAGTATGGGTLTPAARKTVAAAFALSDRAKIIQALEAGAAKQTSVADKKAVLAELASYEERLGLVSAAADHYAAAASADPANRDDALLLDAARACLASNDTERADGYVRTVLLSGFDDGLLARSRVYAAWIELSSGDAASALSLIRTLSQAKSFDAYAPELLFTLWWAAGDAASRDRLIASYPASPEAAVASGTMNIAPAPFWYLMGRNQDSVATFAREGAKNLPKPITGGNASSGTVQSAQSAQSASPAGSSVVDTSATTTHAATATSADATTTVAATTAVATPKNGEWQQVGFFKNREYADELVARLVKLGFAPVVRGDKRPSGTVYFAVLVPEDGSRTVAARLKDAGFESYLVIDGQ